MSPCCLIGKYCMLTSLTQKGKNFSKYISEGEKVIRDLCLGDQTGHRGNGRFIGGTRRRRLYASLSMVVSQPGACSRHTHNQLYGDASQHMHCAMMAHPCLKESLFTPSSTPYPLSHHLHPPRDLPPQRSTQIPATFQATTTNHLSATKD